MKKGGMKIDFANDMLETRSQMIPLQTTFNGHYLLPLTKATQLISSLDTPYEQNVILTVRSTLTPTEIATKLHRQFAHPTKDKLKRLVNNAGKPWANNKELLQAIDSVSDSCDICQRFRKSPPRPVVGMPMATRFLESVAMDLKFYNGQPILHMIDLCTRLSAGSVMPNKKPETVIKHILQSWVAVYGSTDKFLVDNGGEFANPDFINLAEKFGITVQTTAAYSPWSNDTVERHNQTISNMLDKVLAESSCDLPTALAWVLNSKNSLHNVNGFTPFQLSIGTNPKLPSTLTDQPPALTAPTTSKVLSDNLSALHKARLAFIESEHSERIRRALSHNIRSSGDVKYLTGDKVYFKRDDSPAWHGPAKVLGQDDQQVLLKYGSYYVRVHPCRIQLIESSSSETTSNNQATKPDSQAQTKVIQDKNEDPSMDINSNKPSHAPLRST